VHLEPATCNLTRWPHYTALYESQSAIEVNLFNGFWLNQDERVHWIRSAHFLIAHHLTEQWQSCTFAFFSWYGIFTVVVKAVILDICYGLAWSTTSRSVSTLHPTFHYLSKEGSRLTQWESAMIRFRAQIFILSRYPMSVLMLAIACCKVEQLALSAITDTRGQLHIQWLWVPELKTKPHLACCLSEARLFSRLSWVMQTSESGLVHSTDGWRVWILITLPVW